MILTAIEANGIFQRLESRCTTVYRWFASFFSTWIFHPRHWGEGRTLLHEEGWMDSDGSGEAAERLPAKIA